MQHTDIDPALGLMGEFGKVTKGTVRHINQMRQDAIFADGAVPCAACPGTVKASLQRVPGVTNVVVSAEDKTAVVTYDDSKAQVDALVKATTNAGYPSTPKG